MMFRYLTAACALVASTASADAQSPRAFDVYAVTQSGTAVVAMVGPATGCNITSTTDLIVNLVGTAGTAASGPSQLQPASGTPYQCGPIGPGVQVSVNCSGGGTCTWTGYRW